MRLYVHFRLATGPVAIKQLRFNIDGICLHDAGSGYDINLYIKGNLYLNLQVAGPVTITPASTTSAISPMALAFHTLQLKLSANKIAEIWSRYILPM